MSDLLVVNTEEIVPLDFFTGNGVEAFLTDVKGKVESFEADVSTTKGIAEVKSAAASISRAKTAIDNLGKDEVAKLKALPKKIDAKRKLFRDTMDELKEQVRKPVTEIEEAEKAKALAEEMELQRIEQERIADLERREAELKAKEEEIKRKEREEQIRKESAELAKREQAAQLKAAEDAKIAAEAKAKADAEQAERDKEAAIQKVKDDAAKAEADRLAKEAHDKEIAEQMAAEAAEEEAARVANMEYRRSIQTEASLSFQHCFTVEQSDKIVNMIASKQIKHVSITY